MRETTPPRASARPPPHSPTTPCPYPLASHPSLPHLLLKVSILLIHYSRVVSLSHKIVGLLSSCSIDQARNLYHSGPSHRSIELDCLFIGSQSFLIALEVFKCDA